MSRTGYIQTFSEFFPIVAFFIAGQIASFNVAAIVLVVTTVASLLLSFIQLKSVPVMPLFSASIVVFFGGLTLWFDEPGFLIFADTFYYFSLAGLVAAFFFRKKHLLEHMFDQTFAMNQTGWRLLSLRWCAILVLAGIANEGARFFLEPETWINYRFLKVLLLVSFSFYQITLSTKYRIPEESNKYGFRTKPQPAISG